MFFKFFIIFLSEIRKYLDIYYFTMDLRNIILNAKEPMVLKNTLDWSMLEWSLTDWKELLKDKQLKFRCGNNSHTEQPQWERTTNEKHMTFENFISLIKDEEKWYYFDYKYLREWLCDVKSLQDVRTFLVLS